MTAFDVQVNLGLFQQYRREADLTGPGSPASFRACRAFQVAARALTGDAMDSRPYRMRMASEANLPLPRKGTPAAPEWFLGALLVMRLFESSPHMRQSI